MGIITPVETGQKARTENAIEREARRTRLYCCVYVFMKFVGKKGTKDATRTHAAANQELAILGQGRPFDRQDGWPHPAVLIMGLQLAAEAPVGTDWDVPGGRWLGAQPPQAGREARGRLWRDAAGLICRRNGDKMDGWVVSVPGRTTSVSQIPLRLRL